MTTAQTLSGRALVVSKTQKGASHICVGGILLGTNESVRMLMSDGSDLPSSANVEIGELYDIIYIKPSDCTPPHVEDIRVQSAQAAGTQPSLSQYVPTLGVNIWRGAINQIYDGKIGFTANGSTYCCDRLGLPAVSTGFWYPDRDLAYKVVDGKGYYYYAFKRLSYVGVAPSIQLIAANTLVRVSLARIWPTDPADTREPRCYAQLSGWY